jgi:hypothetical protein
LLAALKGMFLVDAYRIDPNCAGPVGMDSVDKLRA